MATYGTDMVLLATGSDAEGGTWTEFGTHVSGGNPGAETENYIQGTQSFSQTFGNAVTGKSIAFDAGSDISGTIPSGDVVMAWVFMGAPTNMYTYASGGHRFGIGVDVDNYDAWSISGDDRPPNPYGGWWSIAVDPTITPDWTGGTGSGGAWQFFGSLIGDSSLGIRVKIQKGNPHAVDGMLMGRGEIFCTGTGATFTLMAADNDAVANRWGLLQDTGGGTFLWKGLMSLGQVGTSATFSASNQTVVVDDTAKVTATFNKVALRHTSTSVTWINISFSARGTTSKGDMEMVENGTWVKNGCSFNGLGTFDYLSGATITSCNYNSCGTVTQGGSTLTGCVFDKSTAATGALVADDLDIVTGCTFTSTASTGYHAVNLGTIAATATVAWDNVLVSVASEWLGTDGTTIGSNVNLNAAIDVNVASGQTLTIATTSASTVPTVQNSGPGTVIITADTVVVSVIVRDNATSALLSLAHVQLFKTSDYSTVVLSAATTASGIVQDPAYKYTVDEDVEGWVRQMDIVGTDYTPTDISGTITSSGLALSVRLNAI
jgi:hypothetical protein